MGQGNKLQNCFRLHLCTSISLRNCVLDWTHSKAFMLICVVVISKTKLMVCLVWFFMSQSTIFQSCWDRSSWFEQVLSSKLKVLHKDITQGLCLQWGSTQQHIDPQSYALPTEPLQNRLMVVASILKQGSYRQIYVIFKDFSRTSKRLSYCFQRLKT